MNQTWINLEPQVTLDNSMLQIVGTVWGNPLLFQMHKALLTADSHKWTERKKKSPPFIESLLR